MKKYFNFTYAIVLLCAVFMLSACGGSGKADAEYEGKYISVAGEAMGMTLTGEESMVLVWNLKTAVREQ